jgi:DNA-binding transcriptional LysR family regulator
MNYTLNQLQIFLKVVQTRSVTKASEELNITQPAVSIQLKNLQDQFEIPLTEVIGRKIHITDFGNEIAILAENIIAQVHEINFKTLAFKGKLTGKLKISIVSTGKYIMPYFLSDFVNNNEGVELIMDVTNRQHVLESLENNATDFALVSILPANLKIEKIDLLQNKLFLIGRKGIVNKDAANKQIFERIPLIYREKGSGTRKTMESFLEENEISTIKKIELTSNEAVKQAILSGLGYSIMPLIGIKNELQSGQLEIIPVNGLPIITTWSLIWMKGKNHSPAAKSFLSFIQAEKNNIIHNKFEWYEAFR